MLTTTRQQYEKQHNSLNWVIAGIVLCSFILRLIVIGNNPLLVEEAYYFQYANHLDFSYLDHPPMVALLIKLTTSLFGLSEWAVRISALFCWFGTALYSMKLTQSIAPKTGRYALLLLCVLPFFMFESVIITPDAPLLLCWSALLYYLHQALVCERNKAWYYAGIALGLGLLSKYTIVLLVPATLIFLLIVPEKRRWFLRYQPYLATLLALLIFTPVIYWNARHGWASFLFQTSRRVGAPSQFSFHLFLLLMFALFTHLGVYSCIKLFTKTSRDYGLSQQNKCFAQVMLLFPLSVFALFSLTHRVNFDWLGPILLALIPWCALSMDKARRNTINNLRSYWMMLAGTLVLIYGVLSIAIYENAFMSPNGKVFGKFIDWEDYAVKVNQIAKRYEQVHYKTPVIVPRDPYNLASELTFYQSRLVYQHELDKNYAIIGEHIVGLNSLMYEYWDKGRPNILTNPVILLAYDKQHFDEINAKKYIKRESKVHSFWVKSMNGKQDAREFYYKIVRLKHPF